MLLVFMHTVLKHSSMKTIIQLGFAIILGFTFAGCSGGMVITSRPDTPYYDRPASPGPDYVWIDGDWEWLGGRYVYHNGYWGHPRGGRAWVSGNWEQHGNGWRWHKGRWH
jgi:hypothetical protein